MAAAWLLMWSTFITSSAVYAHEVNFVPRPSHFRKDFPDPAKFHQTGSGRRLGEAALQVEQQRFEADDGGYHFVLDIGGRMRDVDVLDLDQTLAVAALACDPLENGVALMSIIWAEGKVPGVDPSARRLPLPGATILGSFEWNCSLPTTSKEEDPGSEGGDADENSTEPSEPSFSVVVVEVESEPTSEDPTSVVLVKRVSPLSIFEDLDVKFTWFQEEPDTEDLLAWRNASDASMPDNEDFLAQRNVSNASLLDWHEDDGHDRRLPSVDRDFSFNFVDNKVDRKWEFGGLVECSRCFATASVLISFEMLVRSGLPVGVKLVVAPSFHVEVVLRGKHSASGLGRDWQELWSKGWPSANIANMLLKGSTLPILGKLNDWTVKLNLHPYIAVEGLFDVPADGFEMVGSFTYVYRPSFLVEIAWDIDRGFSKDVTVGGDRTPTVEVPSRLAVPVQLGLALCIGLRMTVYRDLEVITSLTACPEIRFGITVDVMYYAQEAAQFLDDALGTFLASDPAWASNEPDARLCIENIEFRTQVSLDWGADEPYLRFCFAGMCKETEEGEFSGSGSASFNRVCFDVQWSWLAQNPLSVEALEADASYFFFWNDDYDRYTEKKSFNFGSSFRSSRGPGSVRDYEMPRHGSNGPGYISFTAQGYSYSGRRLSSDPEDQSFSLDTVGEDPYSKFFPDGMESSAALGVGAADVARGRRASQDCSAAEVQISFGLHASFGGLTLPSTWVTNPYTVMDSMSTPTWAIVGPLTLLCYDEHPTATAPGSALRRSASQAYSPSPWFQSSSGLFLVALSLQLLQ